MAVHFTSEEQEIIHHSRIVGRNIGFVVGGAAALALVTIGPQLFGYLFNGLGTHLAPGTAPGLLTTLFSSVGVAISDALTALGGMLTPQLLGAALVVGTGGLIGAHINANRAENKAKQRIIQDHQATAEARAAYMASRAMQPQIVYQQGMAGRMGDRIMSEPEVQRGQGV